MVGAARAGAPRRRRRRRGRRARGGVCAADRRGASRPSGTELRRDAVGRAGAGGARAPGRGAEDRAQAGRARHDDEAVATLRAVTRVDDKALGGLLADGERGGAARRRRALAGAGGGDEPLEGALAKDARPEVAAAAGASLCRDVRAESRRRSRARPSCARASWRRPRGSGCARWRSTRQPRRVNTTAELQRNRPAPARSRPSRFDGTVIRPAKPPARGRLTSIRPARRIACESSSTPSPATLKVPR